MIEGLKIKVTSQEIKEQLESRSKYHKERAKWYETQVSSLRSGGVRLEAVSNDPVTSLESSAKHHKEKAAFFSFMAEHIIPNEEYFLSENDLLRIEIVSRFF